MKIKSKEKYLEKFFEVLQKFQNILLKKILNLTPREMMLLDQMHKEERAKNKSSISYIVVSLQDIFLHFFSL